MLLLADSWTFLGMSVIELVAVAFGVACVVLTIRQNIWCWPVGLVQVVLFIWVFYNAKLYSDVGLHIIYVVLSIYGWYHWLRGGRDHGPAIVTRLPLSGLAAWAAAGVLAAGGLGLVMDRLTDASLPYWDAATTTLSLVAQFLMARKKLESWLFWIVVDVLAIGVYLAKGLYPTSVLYAVFLVLATLGFFAWLKSYRRRESVTPEAPAPG